MKIEFKAMAGNIVFLLILTGCSAQVAEKKEYKWEVHDYNRPAPQVVVPGQEDNLPPSDAIVLFDGKDLSQWESTRGGPAKWKVENGYMEAVRETGDIRTKKTFGDCQLHIEWSTPAEVKGDDQGRGNSGVFLMEKYEVQVLDSYDNKTYADGQAGAVYGQKPPEVNCCRAPGEWQSYDIIFHRPIFEAKKLVRPATMTVLHNGVLIQDHWVIEGTTFWKRRAEYQPHPERLPIILQDHGNPVRYRNIWIRQLKEQTE